MRSTLRWVDGEIEERLGAARLRFALQAEPQRLSMQLKSLRFLGLPCPRWLMPEILAEERDEDGRFHFHILASVPLIGRVAAYRGYLELGSA